MENPEISTYLTIPYAPNYEINGKLNVRNKKRGKKLKNQKGVVNLFVNGKKMVRSLRQLYMAAIDGYYDVYDNNQWSPCSLLKGRYEINGKGELRNVKTKYKLKLGKDRRYTVRIDGQQICILLQDLLLDVFGIIYKKARNAPRAVILRKDSFAQYFTSLNAAAHWLSNKIHYAPNTLRTYMSKKQKELFGWQIEYLGRR
ncbi:MAG: hypothetical protein IJT73_03575 [Selenomonadaceae bacterium]|nr:hypothetical protein [Selenomonadaceae bacterium]